MTATRYALKREVAHFECGNSRGVCPILNRATVISQAEVSTMLLANGALCVTGFLALRLVCSVSRSLYRASGFLFTSHRERTGALRSCGYLIINSCLLCPRFWETGRG